MAKKKKSGSSSASAGDQPVPATAAADAEAARIQTAFDVGNFSLVRQLAAKASSSDAKAAVDRLMERVRIDRDQVIVGFIGLAVVLVACVLTLR